MLHSLLFCIFFLASSLSYAKADSTAPTACRKLVIAADVIAKTLPRALSIELNALHSSRQEHIMAHDALHSILIFLGFETSGNIDAVLKSVFANVRNDSEWASRFYASSSDAEEASLQSATLNLLVQRFEILDSFLVKNQRDGDSKQMAALLEVLIGDWIPQLGFGNKLALNSLNAVLLKANDAYLRRHQLLSAVDEEAPAAEWKDPRPTYVEDSVPAKKTDMPQVFIFSFEDHIEVLNRVSRLTEADYKNAKNKITYDSFEDLAEVDALHFYTAHIDGAKHKPLIEAYLKAMDFLIQEVVATQHKVTSVDKAETIRVFLKNMLKIVEGTQAERFSDRFIDYARSELKDKFFELRTHLLEGQFRDDLFDNFESKELLDNTLIALGLDPI